MCDAYNKQHGTSIKPQDCVKHYGDVWSLPTRHPVFDDKNYNPAVAIIEDKPVFVGDKIYGKDSGAEFSWSDPCYMMQLNNYSWVWTLTPPKPKRTFDFNGQQLPCPIDDNFGCRLDFLGNDFFFESVEDRNKVAKAINDLLNNARDKE